MPTETEMVKAFQGRRIKDVDQMLLVAKIVGIMRMIGCPTNTPGEMDMLEKMIRKHYGIYTIEEFCLAFEMNSTHRLSEKMEHYNVFSFDFISNVMYLYTKKANEVRKEIKPVEEEEVPELEPIDIIEYSFQDWRSGSKDFERLINGLRVFELLHETGLKVWTKEDSEKARKKLIELINFKAEKMNLIAQKEYKSKWTKDWLKQMGKQLAVAIWFEEQIQNEKTTLK